MKTILSVFAGPLVLMAAIGTTAVADEAQLKRGEAVLTRDCARCHAIGRAGTSPHPQAPAFRTLGSRYPVDALEEALGEGIISGHPDMPEFRFEGPDVGAIIVYLKSIQQP